MLSEMEKERGKRSDTKTVNSRKRPKGRDSYVRVWR